MFHQSWKPLILAVSALSASAIVPMTVHAQDQDHQEQRTEDHRDDQSARHDERRDDQPATRRDEYRDDQPGRRDEARDEPRRDEARDDQPARRHDDRRDEGGDDPVARYRHDHPRASARCQDGYFTQTRNRDRACSKHGGIDVWIAL